METESGQLLRQCLRHRSERCELGGGSIRINDPALQDRMFKALGFTEEKARESFGFLMDAYKYGHSSRRYGLRSGPHGHADAEAGFHPRCYRLPQGTERQRTDQRRPETVEEKQLRELNIATVSAEA